RSIEATAGVDGVASSVRELRTTCPSLVVLDVELGDGDAFDVFSHVMKMPVIPRVVVISGVAGPEQAFRLAQLGVSRYVQKPIDLGCLEQAVTRALVEPSGHHHPSAECRRPGALARARRARALDHAS
ncbi:MAG: response regulator, partial [Myxococcaceae bacterium]|nr:response regulator [Myxococcaceae bacterium]